MRHLSIATVVLGLTGVKFLISFSLTVELLRLEAINVKIEQQLQFPYRFCFSFAYRVRCTQPLLAYP